MRRRLVIGLLGGVAAGKSTVARAFAAEGAEVVDADALAHRALRRADVKRRLRARFGAGVFARDGGVDRGALAAVVFADRKARRALERIVHPFVRRAIGRRLAAGASQVVVLDVPLLEEGGLLRRCDATVFVDAPLAARVRRARARGWSPAELARRESAQARPSEKRRGADFVIRNAGPRSRLPAAVRRVLLRLRPIPLRRERRGARRPGRTA